MTEETRFLKEGAYDCPSQRSTSVTSGWYRILSFAIHAFIGACYKAKITFLQIAGRQEMETSMGLPHLLSPECQEESYAVQANVFAEQAFQSIRPKKWLCDDECFPSFTYIYKNTHRHGGGMLCTQTGGRCALS